MHSHDDAPALDVPFGMRRLVIGFLVIGAIATIIGGIVLWAGPHTPPKNTQYAAPGVTFPSGEVTSTTLNCPDGPTCGQLLIKVTSGSDQGTRVAISVPRDVIAGGVRAGDKVELVRLPAIAGMPADFQLFGVNRHLPLGVLALVFVGVVLLVARLRGLLAIVGLGISGLVVVELMLPTLLAGRSPVLVACVGAAAILYPVLYLAHGVSMRTSTALVGTIVGAAITIVTGWFAADAGRLSGVGDETGALLQSQVHLDFKALLLCAIVLASLGVLNDVTITQTSAVWELRAAAPSASRAELFARGMRIGRDHIASTIYTIVFAYVGASLALILLVDLYGRPFGSLLNAENVAEEVVRTLAAAIGLVLAVPVTTAIAVVVAGKAHPHEEPHHLAPE